MLCFRGSGLPLEIGARRDFLPGHHVVHAADRSGYRRIGRMNVSDDHVPAAGEWRIAHIEIRIVDIGSGERHRVRRPVGEETVIGRAVQGISFYVDDEPVGLRGGHVELRRQPAAVV